MLLPGDLHGGSLHAVCPFGDIYIGLFSLFCLCCFFSVIFMVGDNLLLFGKRGSFWLTGRGSKRGRKMAGRVAMKYVVALLAAALTMAFGSSSMENGFEGCEKIVKSWADSAYAFDDDIDGNQSKNLQDFLFFLHVARTGGLSFRQCFLMQLYHGRDCPISCSSQGWDSRKPKCIVSSMHADYSLMSRLPKKRTSVVTMSRHPLDRVVSMYELFTVRAGAYLLYPNLTSAMEAAEKECSEWPHMPCFLNIWPSNHLLQRVGVELFARRDGRRNQSMTSEEIDPYNMDQITMPLHDFVNDPLVHELVHNAATLQVAGLAENSYLEGSRAIRRCIRMHPSLGDYVLDVAKKRLDKMLFVGLTEKHKESMAMFAHIIEAQLQELSSTAPEANKVADNDTEKSSSVTDIEIEKSRLQQHLFTVEFRSEFLLGNAKMSNRNMTVENLMEAYAGCEPRLRELRNFLATNLMKEIYPIKFSKKARKQIHISVIQQILSYNNLDIELHKHAEGIFKQQQHRFEERLSKVESQKDYSTSNWLSKMVVLAAIVLLCVLLLLLHARKAPSKFKDY